MLIGSLIKVGIKEYLKLNMVNFGVSKILYIAEFLFCIIVMLFLFFG